jgi:vWA-MoxR associated protein C-terminal domain
MIWDCHSPKLTELRNVLVEFSVFQTPEERRKVVGALPFASDIEDRTAAITHVEEIVKVCARNLTGFDVLLEALERFETEPLDAVYETLDHFQAEYASLITFSELRQLKLIVDPPNRDLVSDIIAAEAYKRANPLIPMQGRIQHGRRFVRALEHLAKLCHIAPVQGPLFAFLEDCRPCLELPGVRELLVVWEEEVANRLKLDLVTIRATVRTKAGGAPPAVPTLEPIAPEVPMPVLQVKIEPVCEEYEGKQPAEMRYRLAAWLWKGAEGEPLAGVPAGLYSAAALETALPLVVHAALQQLDDDQMRIEVILPRELLELKIEGAPFPNGLDQVPIGFEWPVVVRSYDRLYDEQNFLLAQRKWKRKWRRLTQPLAASDIAWACESAAYSPQFLAGLDAQTLAFVAFTLTPAACTDCTTASHVLNKVLTTGIPLAVWLRDHNHTPQGSQQLLRDALLTASPTAWPGRVRELRTNWFRTPASAPAICSGLTLFWDDAQHLPPDVPSILTKPAQRANL